MPFLEHLEELRRRLFYSVIAVMVLSVFVFTFGLRSIEVGGLPFSICYPFPDPFNSITALVFERIVQDLLGDGVTLIALTPFDAMVTQIKISIFLGVLLGMPFIMYNVITFIGPGLYPKEKLMIMSTVPVSAIMFVMGALFAYYILAPFTFGFLYEYTESMGVEKTLAVEDFVGFVVVMLGAFGVLFELPVVMTMLSYLGIVKPDMWRSKWRIVTVAIAIIAAAITPDGTGITMMIVAVPLLILYWAGYFASILAYRNYLQRTSKAQ